MRFVFVLIGFFSVSGSFLEAGSVYLITDQPEVHGKLALDGPSIHVGGTSIGAIDLADVLEADFSDDDFHFDYFSSSETTAEGLPRNWKGQDIGKVDSPGSANFAKGTFTISGNGREMNSDKDRHYYLYQPWTGNGEWSVHIKELSPAEMGILLRETIDPSAAIFGFGTVPVRIDGGGNGLRHNRNNAGEGSQWNAFLVPEPFWLRVRRSGTDFDIALSSDGNKWQNIEEDGMAKFPVSFLAGFFISSNAEDKVGKAVLDHVLFTPLEAEPAMLPGGVLLTDGTFLNGSFDQLDPANGVFHRLDQLISVTTDHVASVIFDSVRMDRLAKNDPKAGILLQNDDFAESTLKLVQGRSCDMVSTVLGNQHYDSSKALACVLQPVKLVSSDYEVRLKDGSCIRASGVSASNGQLAIQDVSGLTIIADMSEVEQIRAGSNLVQTLTDFGWQATPAAVPVPVPVAAPASPPAVEAKAPVNAPATNSALSTNTPAAAAPALEQIPTVQCWQGNHQEHIMAVRAGTSVDFPLGAKFRSLALKIALSSDAAADAKATVRIMADGVEVARTHPLKAGDQPHFFQVALQNPKTVTLVADSAVAGTKVLYIDPVAIRN